MPLCVHKGEGGSMHQEENRATGAQFCVIRQIERIERVEESEGKWGKIKIGQGTRNKTELLSLSFVMGVTGFTRHGPGGS